MADMTIDEYLDAAPEPHRATLQHLRETVRRLLPDSEETISYNLPAFTVNGKVIAGFAYFNNHCSYLPHSGSVLGEIADELEGYKWTKGSLQFPVDEPLPEGLVQRLIDVRREQLGV